MWDDLNRVPGVNIDKEVDGQPVKTGRRNAGVQQPSKGIVAKIFEQQKPMRGVLGHNGGRAVAILPQRPGDE